MLQFKKAIKSDSSLVLQMLREAAQEQNLQDEFFTTEEVLLRDVFEKERANVLIIQQGEDVVGVVVFFFNFASFIGCSGIYIEDIYVRPAFQGQGLGKKILSYMAGYALENNCGLLEWLVFDENKRARNFYEKMGASAENGWTVHRAKGDALKRMATLNN